MTPWKHATPPPDVSHHTKFRRSRSNRLGLVGDPKIWRRWAPPLGTEAWVVPRNMLLHHLGYHAKFGHSRSNHMRVIMEIHRKNDPSRPAFQGHSRSLEPTRIDRLPITSYSWSIEKHGYRAYHFPDKRRFWSKIVYFPTPVHLTPR